jgi:hypothetical protein
VNNIADLSLIVVEFDINEIFIEDYFALPTSEDGSAEESPYLEPEQELNF